MMDPTLADAVRIFLLLAWGFILVISVAVVLTYNDLRKNSPDVLSSHANLRLMSQHVVYLGSSYIVSVTANAYVVASRFDQDWDHWMAVFAVILAFGAVGLLMVLKFQFSRLRRGGSRARG